MTLTFLKLLCPLFLHLPPHNFTMHIKYFGHFNPCTLSYLPPLPLNHFFPGSLLPHFHVFWVVVLLFCGDHLTSVRIVCTSTGMGFLRDRACAITCSVTTSLKKMTPLSPTTIHYQQLLKERQSFTRLAHIQGRVLMAPIFLFRCCVFTSAVAA